MVNHADSSQSYFSFKLPFTVVNLPKYPLFFLKIIFLAENTAKYIVLNPDESRLFPLHKVSLTSLQSSFLGADNFSGVSYELCDPPNSVGTSNSLVGYSIRLESNITRNTRLAFVTNGIALRMLEGGSGQGGQGTAFDEITVAIPLPLFTGY